MPNVRMPTQGKAQSHAWCPESLAEIYVGTSAGPSPKLDPANAEAYRRKMAEAYRAQLRASIAELHAACRRSPPRRRVLATLRTARSLFYLARITAWRRAYLWPVNANPRLTPKRMARLIALVREREVPAVFCESKRLERRTAQRQVAKESAPFRRGVSSWNRFRRRWPPAHPAWDCSVNKRRRCWTALGGELIRWKRLERTLPPASASRPATSASTIHGIVALHDVSLQVQAAASAGWWA